MSFFKVDMERRSGISPFVIVLIASFLLGIFSVFLRRAARQDEMDNAAPTPVAVNLLNTEATTPEPSRHTSVALLLGVDTLSTTSPTLRSLWIIEFHPSGRDIRFLGVPVDLQLAGPSTPSLQDVFTFSRGTGVGEAFISTANYLSPYPADFYIVLDEIALETGLDFLGGVNLEGDNFTGSQLVRVLRLLADDPSADLKMQAEILSKLVNDAVDLSSNLDITPLVALIPEHAYTSVDPLALSSMAASMLPVRPEDIVIDLFLP